MDEKYGQKKCCRLIQALPEVASKALSLPGRSVHSTELLLADLSSPDRRHMLGDLPPVDLLFEVVLRCDEVRNRQRVGMRNRLIAGVGRISPNMPTRQVILRLLEPEEFDHYQSRVFPFHYVVAGLRRPRTPRMMPWRWPVKLVRNRVAAREIA